LTVASRRSHEIFLDLHDGIFGWLLLNHHEGYETIQWEYDRCGWRSKFN
jgi:hypothetical protein